MTHEHPHHIEQRELEQRVFLALLRLSIKTADNLGLSLKDVLEWVRVAYYKELKEQNLSHAQIAQRLDVSERTVKNMSRALRESFSLPEQEHNLPTQIEFMLWRTPMSLARLKQVLQPIPEADTQAAIDVLLEQGRIRLDEERRTPAYVPTQSINAQISPEWIKRVGSLNSLIGNLYDTVKGRFFIDDARAFARTLTFYIQPSGYDSLHQLFWQTLVPAIAALDEKAHEESDAEPVRMTMFWSPLHNQD